MDDPYYGGVTKYGRAGPDGQPTHGGYSDAMVVNERFAFKVPDDADLAKEGTSSPCIVHNQTHRRFTTYSNVYYVKAVTLYTTSLARMRLYR